MRLTVTVLFVLVSFINLAPVVGVLSSERLAALYGFAIEDPNLLVLLRHRAALFGVVGALLLAAAFVPWLRPIAVAAGLFSMLSYVAIVWHVGGTNSQLGRVAVVDLVATVMLVAAALLDRRLGSAS